MNGRVLSRANLALVLGAAGLFAASPALSADLGGDCCADLEERVAELEATTARKGNRKVKLTISGWVNEAIFGWDDGTAHGVYQGTNSLEQSRFRFTGEAKINKDWSAGFILEVGVQGNPSSQFAQSHDASTSVFFINQDRGMIIRKDNWFIKNKDLGQVAVGLNGTATYHLLDDADATNTRSFADAEGPAVYMGSFLIRSGGNFVSPASPLKWTDVLRGFNNSTPGQGGRRSVVRYDSPEVAGFVLTAAWGQSDQWDAALTYKGSWNGISVLAKAGYGSSNDPGLTPVAGQTLTQSGTACGGTQPGIDANGFITPVVNNYACTWEGAAATIKHDPTGLYVFGGWGRQQLGSFLSTAQDPAKPTTPINVFEQDSSFWFIQPGIEQKWFPVGKTTIFGGYRHDDPGSNPGKTLDANITFWQGGVVQNFEAAALDLYLIYQHADGSVTGCSAATCPVGVAATTAPNGVTSIDPFQEIIAGGKINF
jgi:predicted porin